MTREPVFDDEAREAAFRRHQRALERCPVLPGEFKPRRRRGKRLPDITIAVTTQYTAEVRGKHVLVVLQTAGCPRQYLYRPPSGGEPCWAIPVAAVADVEAAAVYEGGTARHEGQTLWGAA